MNNSKSKDKKRDDLRDQIIQRKNNEIELLKDKISELEIEIEKKDELVKSVDPLRKELLETTNDLKAKKDEYNKIISELKEMKKIMNEEVFKGRWNLIKLLMK